MLRRKSPHSLMGKTNHDQTVAEPSNFRIKLDSKELKRSKLRNLKRTSVSNWCEQLV